jgi:AraC family transcriptional activator FtrA
MPATVRIMPKPPQNLRVAVLAYDGLCTFEFGIAVEIFGLERPEMGPRWYRLAIAAEAPQRPLRAAGGITVQADGGLELLEAAGTIIIPGWRGAEAPVPEAITAALRAAHARGARVLSLCSGVFVLAAAGLLEGRRATTHWRYAAALAARYPGLSVDPDVLYVDEGSVLTAAGSAAGIDLCLHLIRRDFGPEAANSVARRLVVPPHREGGQAQYIERPVPRERAGGAKLAALLDAVRGALAEDWPIARLARVAALSERGLHRRFREATGQSPGAWLLAERLSRAREILETTRLPVEEVAEAVGFGSAATLRLHFRERLATSPAAYRRRFTAVTSPQHAA